MKHSGTHENEGIYCKIYVNPTDILVHREILSIMFASHAYKLSVYASKELLQDSI